MKHKLAIMGIVLLAFVFVTSVTIAGSAFVRLVANDPNDHDIPLEADANGYLYVSGTAAMITDLAAIEVLLGTINTDTGAMVTDLAALEVLQTTIAGDTTAIQAAAEIIDDAYGVADDDDTGACHALGVASAQHTLTAAGWHTVSCTGNSCPILCGSNPTATAAANGHFIKIPDGAGHRLNLAGSKCAYLAGNGIATGEICFTYEGL